MTALAHPILPLECEFADFVTAAPDRVFAFLDQHARLASHMANRSWKLGGGRMETSMDAGHGQVVGSHIRIAGTVLGIALQADEIVTERHPPRVKAWETVGTPKLLVINHYRMGFEVLPKAKGSMLRVFIAYDLPETRPGRWLGALFGTAYATWCAREMVRGAVAHFAGIKAAGQEHA